MTVVSTSEALGRATERADEPQFDLRRKHRFGEKIIQGFLFVCGAISILTTLGIVYVLGRESLRFSAVPKSACWSFSPKRPGSRQLASSASGRW